MTARALALLLIVPLCACAGRGTKSHAAATAAPSVRPLLYSRGVVMPLTRAVRELTFAPFIPSRQIVAVAVIPPLSDDAGKRAAGLAVEYENGGDALVLSQWPREGLPITVGPVDVTTRPCAPVAYKPDGFLWTTRNGRVMTLQPDGAVMTTRLQQETSRLLRTGACGPRTRTLSRPLPARSPAASLPRQSAF